jgi:hypothetical protein
MKKNAFLNWYERWGIVSEKDLAELKVIRFFYGCIRSIAVY